METKNPTLKHILVDILQGKDPSKFSHKHGDFGKNTGWRLPNRLIYTANMLDKWDASQEVSLGQANGAYQLLRDAVKHARKIRERLNKRGEKNVDQNFSELMDTIGRKIDEVKYNTTLSTRDLIDMVSGANTNGFVRKLDFSGRDPLTTRISNERDRLNAAIELIKKNRFTFTQDSATEAREAIEFLENKFYKDQFDPEQVAEFKRVLAEKLAEAGKDTYFDLDYRVIPEAERAQYMRDAKYAERQIQRELRNEDSNLEHAQRVLRNSLNRLKEAYKNAPAKPQSVVEGPKDELGFIKKGARSLWNVLNIYTNRKAKRLAKEAEEQVAEQPVEVAEVIDAPVAGEAGWTDASELADSFERRIEEAFQKKLDAYKAKRETAESNFRICKTGQLTFRHKNPEKGQDLGLETIVEYRDASAFREKKAQLREDYTLQNLYDNFTEDAEKLKQRQIQLLGKKGTVSEETYNRMLEQLKQEDYEYLLNKAVVKELREDLETEVKSKLREKKAYLIEKVKRNNRKLAEEKALVQERAQKTVDELLKWSDSAVDAQKPEEDIPYAEPADQRIGNERLEVYVSEMFKKHNLWDKTDEELVDFAIDYMNTKTRARKKRTGERTAPGYRRFNKYMDRMMTDTEHSEFMRNCANALRGDEKAQRRYIGQHLGAKLREYKNSFQTVA
ncbi:hypothetical protein KY335_04355 [Candidatus Woesearchaeota archaeon]|nr:hypothetical protein [Candidatus Woesearchaeota archaeon]